MARCPGGRDPRRMRWDAYREKVRCPFSLLLFLVGCSGPPPVQQIIAEAPAARAQVVDELSSEAEAAPRPAATPLGFDHFAVTPAPPVEWADVLRAEVELIPGSSVYTDVTYRWMVAGRVVRGWKREFLRHEEGRWRKGDRVDVYAIADDGTGRIARTESLSVLIGEKPWRPDPPPPIDWDGLRAEEERTRRIESEDRAAAALHAERSASIFPDDPPDGPGRYGYYVNPSLGDVVLDPRLFPEPRRGISVGPDRKVDGWTPGEPRVDGYTPGEQRVDGWTPGEPRVGR